ncbi:hypothetical protein OQX63_05550 [Pedobacter sp. PF22-3]|uniref:hypothetical protein n=1 Tax=Pedobacter sp. PF22-3 TaxID=2994467 RepID=UPI002247BCC3|nr:hypothetical protein [Pedobacter sp. PF22-3]MCX2492927.1 hypothetical protein [Pedobacter sp. PF22-3]
MKIIKPLSFAFFLITSLSGSSIVLAQKKQTTIQTNITGQIEKVNGNEILERLADQRIALNKNRSNNNFPKAEYIINRSNPSIINFNGLDYHIKNNRLTGIEGLNLSDSVLNQITAKLVLLDSIQFDQSERLNNEYINPKTNPQKIWYIDRQFMLTLKMFSSTVRDIAALTRNENPSLAVEANVAKMRLPNIDKAAKNLNMQSLLSLSK